MSQVAGGKCRWYPFSSDTAAGFVVAQDMGLQPLEVLDGVSVGDAHRLRLHPDAVLRHPFDDVFYLGPGAAVDLKLPPAPV